jgi:hypothetical protein
MDLGNAAWRKSSYSSANGGHCVEVALNLPGTVAVRDSKDLGGLPLLLTRGQWLAFTAAARAGELSG